MYVVCVCDYFSVCGCSTFVYAYVYVLRVCMSAVTRLKPDYNKSLNINEAQQIKQ